MEWRESVGVLCPKCGTSFIVLPPGVSGAIGESFGEESELEFVIDPGKAVTGAALTVADVDRRYSCPACGERGRVLPPEELFTD
jgi:predicted RNA-binding Zn-ribbon protein involved in translation (DUF1610 family)